MDFFEAHDCFTSSEYAAVSAFGITEPGFEYIAIEDGITSFNGVYLRKNLLRRNSHK